MFETHIVYIKMYITKYITMYITKYITMYIMSRTMYIKLKITWVAMPAWSHPGTQRVVRPIILLYLKVYQVRLLTKEERRNKKRRQINLEGRKKEKTGKQGEKNE